MHDQTARDLHRQPAAPQPNLRLAEHGGSEQASATRECPLCRSRVASSDQSCRGCGTELIKPNTTTTITSDPAPMAPAGGPLTGTVVGPPPSPPDPASVAMPQTLGAILPPAPSHVATLPGDNGENDKAITLAQSRLKTVAPAPAMTDGGTVIRRNPLEGQLATPKLVFQPLHPPPAKRPDLPPAAPTDKRGDTTIGPAPHEPGAEQAVTLIEVPDPAAQPANVPAPPVDTPTPSAFAPIPPPPLDEPEATVQRAGTIAPDPGATATFLGRYLSNAGVEQRVHVPEGESLEVGRKPGSPFADDPYVARYHAALTATPDGIQVECFGSLNGVFVQLTAPTALRDGDQFRIGEELLSYEELPPIPETDEDGVRPLGCPNPGYWSRINVLLSPERAAATYPVDEDEVIFGREDGHIIFPDDEFASGQHCRLTADDEGATLEDLGSHNGTFLRVRTGDIVPYGSVLLIGQTLLRLERSA